MADSVTNLSLDALFRGTSTGSLDRALTNNLFRLSHLNSAGMVSSNRDNQGYVFCTRPQLNLQKGNLRNDPDFYPLLTQDPYSLSTAIRVMLDPRIANGYRRIFKGKIISTPRIESFLFDNKQAFIPFISNSLLSMSGGRDQHLNFWSGDAGNAKQVYTAPDGIISDYGHYDISLNLLNMDGDPATATMNYWLRYIANVRFGPKMDPYDDYLVRNTRDYDTRFYRFVLDRQKMRVTKFFMTGVSTPKTNPTGIFFDLNRQSPYSEQTKELNFNFDSVGFFAFDPRIPFYFNKAVMAFNEEMRDANRASAMVRLTQAELMSVGNGSLPLYPRVDLETLNFEWWTSRNATESSKAADDEYGDVNDTPTDSTSPDLTTYV